MVKNLKYYFLAIPILVLVDIFARFLYEKTWFSSVTLSNAVDPMDIFSSVISTSSAIWLGWYITRKLSAQRFEKEYIITDIKKIEEELFSLEKQLKVSNMELQTVLEILNNFNLYINRFSKTLDIFEVKSISPTNLSKAFQKLYVRTTNVEGTHLNIDQTLTIEIRTICSAILIETRQMICAINKK